MQSRRLIPWLICLIFIINGCAGKRIKINTEPKPPEKREDPIKLEVRPQTIMTTRTATIQLTVTIDPSPKNVFLEWAWDSPDGETGSSGRSINGSSQKKFQVLIELTPGEYEIKATVYRKVFGEDNQSFTARSTVHVIGVGSPF